MRFADGHLIPQLSYCQLKDLGRSHPHPAFGSNELDPLCAICPVGLNKKEATRGKSASNFDIYLFF